MLDKVKKNTGGSAKDLRKNQLTEATIKTISKFGLSKTTIARVAGEADMSVGIIGFYFKNKAQLLVGTLKALTEEISHQISLAFEFSDNPRETLELIIDSYLSEAICDVDKIAVWYAFASESGARKEYMEICGEYDAWFHRSLLKEIESLCSEQGIQSQEHALAISRALEGLIDGYWQEFLYQPEQFDRDRAKKICLEYLQVVFPQRGPARETGTARRENAASNPDVTRDFLPVWTYYDPEFLELEKQHLFRKNWLLVGHVNDMPDQGDYLTLDAVGERAFVIRGRDNRIRAFHNVCRHRGAKLFEHKTGRCAHAMICPFHGWTYQLDGRLVGVPAESTFSNLDKSANSLAPLDMEIWMGFVFIRFEPGGRSLAETMKPVEAVFTPYMIENMLPLANCRHDKVLPYNWKVVHDIDNEGYHVPVGHPSLQQLYGKSYVDTTVEGIPISYAKLNEEPAELWSVRHYQSLLPRYDHLPRENRRQWIYGGIFPSMVIGLYPDCIEFYMTLPLTAGTTLSRGGLYALPDCRREAKAARYLNRRINAVTAQEDETYVRTLQHGMMSSVFPQPHLSSLESGVRDFHNKIQDILPVAQLTTHPGKDTVAITNADMMNP